MREPTATRYTDGELHERRPHNKRRTRIITLVVVVGVLAAIVLGYLTYMGLRQPNPADLVWEPLPAQPTLTPNAHLAPRDDAQRDMLNQFRLATNEEAQVVREVPALQGSPALKHIYVVTAKEFTLAAIAEPILLIVPHAAHWRSGPHSLTTILRVPAVTPKNIKEEGDLYSDPMCNLQLAGVLQGNCNDPAVNRPGVKYEMLKSLRHPTKTELPYLLGADYYEGADPNLYYVATEDFWAAPEYKFDMGEGPYDGIVAIFVPRGVHILGGQLGFMDIYVPGREAFSGLDTICFMYGIDGPRGPKAFVPSVELQRVSACTRP